MLAQCEWDWTVISGVLQAIASLAVVVVAAWGLTTWRREQLGRRQAEIAEEVLALFYEAKVAIVSIRSPFGNTDEGKSRKRNDDEPEQEKKILDEAYVVLERYTKREAIFNKLHAIRFRFMAIFGHEQAQPFEQLRQIENQLFSAARKYAVYGRHLLEESGADTSARDRYLVGMEEAQAVFWDGFNTGDDPINPKMKSMIHAIESTCRKAIGARRR